MHDHGTSTAPGSCPPAWKFADIGVHEFRLLVTAGAPASVKSMMPGLADHLAAPPAAYPHLPYDAKQVEQFETLLTLKPANIRLLACKRSWDGEALIVRLQEAVGKKTKAELCIMPAAAGKERGGGRDAEKVGDTYPGCMSPFQERRHSSQESGHEPEVRIPFLPFEIKTLRIEKDGRAFPVRMIEEDRP